MDEHRKRKLNDPADSDDDNRIHTKKSLRPRVDGGQRKMFGPTLPPKHTSLKSNERVISTVDNDDPDSDSSSDDDDDIGPILPPAHTEQARFDSKISAGSSGSLDMSPEDNQIRTTSNQRDEWMLQPPERSDWSSRVDPTKLRNRKFQTGRSARGPPVSSRVDASWTESAEQKMERIRNEVMGAKPSTAMKDRNSRTEASSVSDAIHERIQKFNEATRKDVTRQTKLELGDNGDDPGMRAFDKEKDMTTSSSISNAQRRELLSKAADFGSRFTGGRLL